MGNSIACCMDERRDDIGPDDSILEDGLRVDQEIKFPPPRKRIEEEEKEEDKDQLQAFERMGKKDDEVENEVAASYKIPEEDGFTFVPIFD